ncbi:hypothetical protein PIROE2DRAFT_17232 [Piromyces sp. E2]|nr:hypothetical protein PIROE2DRAFT_17232 [Piromyces sp. E2]|eukprot:OUM57693.1 hypothetical protein PIROE2DRAFT_17232 [Piromyces sp. E2]
MDKEIITDELRELVTPITLCEWEDKIFIRTERGVEKIIEEKVQKYKVKWNKKDSNGNYHIPETAEQFNWIDRTGGGKDIDINEDNGRFLVTALYFCALRAYSPSNEKNFDDMMKVLIESPTTKKKNILFNGPSAQNIRLNLRKRLEGLDKYTYLGKAYFKGATPENQYTLDNPPEVVLESFGGEPEKSTIYGTDIYIYRVKIYFPGADSERILSLYKDKEDGNWYIFSNTYMGFIVDIKRPRITMEEASKYIKKVEYMENEQPVINIKEVIRYAQDPDDSNKIVEQPVPQAQIIFTNNGVDVFPNTAAKLAKIDRSSTYGDLDNDKGRFLTIAAYFAALKSWTPQTANEVNKMMELLCESPTTKVLEKRVFDNFSMSFMRDNLTKILVENTPKYKYIGNSYFDGATPYNEYTPTTPLAVTVEDYVYNGIWSDIYQTKIYRVVSRFEGADTERYLSMYQDPFDHQWYIFSDSYKAFISDIKHPIFSEEKVIELYKKKYKHYAKEITYNDADQPKISMNEVDRQYAEKQSDGKISIIDVKIQQVSITFNNGKDILPKNVNDLSKLNRGGNYEIAKSGIIKYDKSEDLGRFITVAAYVAALKKLDKYNYKDGYDMIKYLCESPTSCALGSDVFNQHSQTFIKNNVLDKELIPKHFKYEYLGNSYFDGASRYNNYTPTTPLTITIEDYVYDGIWSSNYNTYIYTMVTRFKGSDFPRLLKIYQDQYDHQWYIFSDSWKGFCVDIKKPMIKSSITPRTDYIAANQPNIFSEEVDGKYVVYNKIKGIDEIKIGKFTQKKITFNTIPSTAADLSKISRQGPLVQKDDEYRNVSDLDNDNGRFMVAALYIAALRAWTPSTAKEVDAMLKILCESPTSKALGAEVYTNHSSQSMTVSMKQNEKYKYLGFSYFDGTSPENGYMSNDNSITIKDYVYDGDWSDNYESKIYTVVVKSSGADTPRLLKVYQDPFDLEWYIFSDSWKSLILDIRKPIKN